MFVSKSTGAATDNYFGDSEETGFDVEAKDEAEAAAGVIFVAAAVAVALASERLIGLQEPSPTK